MRTCVDCAKPVSRRNASGYCRSCATHHRKPPQPMPLVASCSDCGTGITALSKTGRCRRCASIHYNTLPETRKLRSETWKRRFAEDPSLREKLAKVAARNSQKAMTDPAIRAQFQERARKNYRLYLDTPEVRAKIAASREQAGEKIRELRLGWCPQKYRALHYENVNRHKCTAAESRAMIEKLIADDSALPHIDSALEWLRRLAPVQKLENGYRYGNAILSPAEVIARAKLRGWEPERWAA